MECSTCSGCAWDLLKELLLMLCVSTFSTALELKNLIHGDLTFTIIDSTFHFHIFFINEKKKKKKRMFEN